MRVNVTNNLERFVCAALTDALGVSKKCVPDVWLWTGVFKIGYNKERIVDKYRSLSLSLSILDTHAHAHAHTVYTRTQVFMAHG